MQLKDAASEILKTPGEPLYFYEISDRALTNSTLTTSGLMSHARMGAFRYIDTLKRINRLRRGDKNGIFELGTEPLSDIQRQIKTINIQVVRRFDM